jgi:hypothetical protein
MQYLENFRKSSKFKPAKQHEVKLESTKRIQKKKTKQKKRGEAYQTIAH